LRIGIIGSGNIGGNLTRRLTDLGHEVAVANSRGPDSLKGLADETGATPSTVEEAVRGAELVIVAIPMKAVPDLPAGQLAGLPVVDAGNYYPARDGHIAEIESGTPSSRWVAQHLPGAHVVKAFNNMYASYLLDRALPAGAEGRIALPVAGDDGEARQTVMDLVDDLGFDPVEAGTLDDSWRQEPDTPVYGNATDIAGVEDAVAAARVEGAR
jgi:predicted dinucleotide-binding enzyme